jgi:hypothetical protein
MNPNNRQLGNRPIRRGNKGTSKSASKEIANIVKSIMNQNVEKKWINHSGYNYALSTSSYINDMTDVASGWSSTTRIGNTITIKKFILKVNFVHADATNLLRVVVFVWKPNTISDVPIDNEVLTDTTNGVSIRTLLIPDKPSRFKVLADKVLSVDTYNPQANWELNLNMDHKVQCNSGATTGSEHIFILAVSDSSAATHPNYSYECDVYFTDD